MVGVPIPLPPTSLERVEDSVSEESLSDNHLTECLEYEYGDDQQPKPFNQRDLSDIVRDSICLKGPLSWIPD